MSDTHYTITIDVKAVTAMDVPTGRQIGKLSETERQRVVTDDVHVTARGETLQKAVQRAKAILDASVGSDA